MPSRQEKKRAKRRAKYLEVRDDVLESARASYKADPEKKRTGERERYHADPVKKRSAKRKSYDADPEKKRSAKRESYEADPEKKRVRYEHRNIYFGLRPLARIPLATDLVSTANGTQVHPSSKHLGSLATCLRDSAATAATPAVEQDSSRMAGLRHLLGVSGYYPVARLDGQLEVGYESGADSPKISPLNSNTSNEGGATSGSEARKADAHKLNANDCKCRELDRAATPANLLDSFKETGVRGEVTVMSRAAGVGHGGLKDLLHAVTFGKDGQAGMLGKACKILTSGGLAPNNETAWNLLLSKHPASQLPLIPEITQEPVSLGSDFNILSVLRYETAKSL
eukprot:Em0008g696a